MNRKLKELQETCRAREGKVPKSVVEAFTSANKLVESFAAHISTTELATRVNRGISLNSNP